MQGHANKEFRYSDLATATRMYEAERAYLGQVGGGYVKLIHKDTPDWPIRATMVLGPDNQSACVASSAMYTEDSAP